MEERTTPERFPQVRLDGAEISDWDSFHDAFVRLLGFPDYYGRNMDAWIDCMSDLEVPNDGYLLLSVTSVDEFREKRPEIFDALIECTAFVNARMTDERPNHPTVVLSLFS